MPSAFQSNTIGVMRKLWMKMQAMVHGFTAHQIPDLAGALITFIASLAMIFIFDWRFGLASFILLLGAVLAFFSSVCKKKYYRRYAEIYENARSRKR